MYNRGLAWKLKGDYIKAVEDYNKAIQSNPGDPHSWIRREPGWNKKSTAEQADILYRDITFSGEMSTSDSRIFEVWEVQKTRFGNVLAVSNYEAPHATIVMLNGLKVFDGAYVGIEKYYQIKDSDVILLGVNAGGSATPEVEMSFLVIDSETKTHVVSDPAFVADSYESIKVSTDAKDRIFVNLGFKSGKEMVAEFESDKLIIHANSKKGKPLSDSECQWLFDNGSEQCASQIARQSGCRKYASDAAIYGSNVEMSKFTYISNQPGFIQSGFSKSCLAWCNGKDVSYKHFSKSTCSIR